MTRFREKKDFVRFSQKQNKNLVRFRQKKKTAVTFRKTSLFGINELM